MTVLKAGPQPWTDTARTSAERADALLEEMTLEEKVAQLGSVWQQDAVETTGEVAPMQDVFAAGSRPFDTAVRDGIGHLTRPFGTRPVTADEGRARVVELQRQVVESSRLGVPAIVHEECLTGFTTLGATVYPTSLAWAATFDPELIERMAAAIAGDMRAVGVHQGLSPVLDVVRDYRWGRVEETMGEDPYLVGALGAAYVRGLEKQGLVATLKHFAGYSASRAARNHGPVAMGPRELREYILPTFETAIRAGGARSVMNSYSEIDGVPVGADPSLLTGVLRDEWGFDGVVVSDYWSVPFLQTMHRVAATPAEAGALALTAGIDVELPDAVGYGAGLVELVRSGRVPEELVDRAARRVLRQKAELGLLDPDWTPEGSVAAGAGIDFDSPANRAIAREVAERSVVLLANDSGVLPLTEGTAPRRIAVVGPCADDAQAFMGCYSYPNHILGDYPEYGMGLEAASLWAALRAELPDDRFTLETGCPIRDEDRSGFDAAVAAARDADVCIAVVGDRAGMFGRGTSGEGCDAPDLALPGLQGELLGKLLETGTPVVVVVVSGRPYALGDYEGAAAMIQAFMPGEEGGAAIAGVVSGRLNPSGKLPVQVPRLPGGQPGTYLQPPYGANSEGVSNLDPTAMFGFGHGRSYTTYEYDDLTLSATELPTDGTVTVSVRVRNTGPRDGAEVVQLYLHDVQAEVTRPLLQLAGFARVPLAAGAAARVEFTLHADRTAFVGRDLLRVVDPGEVEIHVGASATDLPCRATVRLTGERRTVGRDRVLHTPVVVGPA
ncbi:glycoside hydrolase family 3 C-terminal domain-containing protein [Couchioplanes caeruleus]|uniref:beta-glucosidase family protein n=1 Tax=Couchioplanes caeruleus TaxID=56438 RepID=UPI00201BFBE3|nr:glycoside hydrolase family 3 N-terminal domain-containing protein [Couchioplanes caeruleus]UQU62058.1 glycoside hydrolase family 3 C-terminal domain-containing protein [Couchioplanes caeruleus]